MKDCQELDGKLYLIKKAVEEGKKFDVEVKPHRNKRSTDANAYCWNLCEEIAKKIDGTKNEVYRQAIQHVGVYEIIPIRHDAVGRYVEAWRKNGIGWIAEKDRDSKFAGYVNVFTYYGSSAYDTKEMSRLIDYIVEEAKRLGIETKTPEQLAELVNLWGGK